MPTKATIVTTTVWAGNNLICLARILGDTGEYLLTTDLSSVTWQVLDLDNSKAVVGSGTFSPGSVVYNTLQTDNIWTKDETGYNFKATVPGANFPLAERRYRVVFSFVTVSWGTFKQPFEAFTGDPTG